MPDGTQATWNRASWDDPTPMYSNNPYWSRYMCYQNDTRHRVYGNVGVSYNILPQLKVQYKANLDFFVDKQYEVNHEFMAMYNDTFGDYTVGANLGACGIHNLDVLFYVLLAFAIPFASIMI